MRTLTVARVEVPEGALEQYRELLKERAAASKERGARFWVFRHSQERGTFLEFTESSARGAASERSGEELVADRKLRELARYDAGADDRWEEFKLTES